MSVTVIVGAQWGDEAKGKFVDLLAQKADMVVRATGGGNAGHTVCFDGKKYKLHHIPSGIFNPKTCCIISAGVVVNPERMIDELDRLDAANVSTENLFFSPACHVVLPIHKDIDQAEEALRGKNKIGTTGQGIGPTYADKARRTGVRLGDLVNPKIAEKTIRAWYERSILTLNQAGIPASLTCEELIQKCANWAERIRPYVQETLWKVRDAVNGDQVVLAEGAQGALLDLDYGEYPFVTSSHPTSAGVCIGSGLNPRDIDAVLGVVKAYSTRVGSGPMPTELDLDAAHAIRERGHEYGTTTGRPRRVGWFDAVALRFACEINGFDSIALTLLDALTAQTELKICTGYELPDGTTTRNYPQGHIAECKAIYETMPGWNEEITACKSFESLPKAAKNYVNRIAEILEIKISYISVGPDRTQTFQP